MILECFWSHPNASKSSFCIKKYNKIKIFVFLFFEFVIWFLEFLACSDRFWHDWKMSDKPYVLLLTCLSNLFSQPGGFAPRAPNFFWASFFQKLKNVDFGILGRWKTYLFIKFWPKTLKIQFLDYQNRIQRPRFTPVGFPIKVFFKIDWFFSNFGFKIWFWRVLTCLGRFRHAWKGLDMSYKLILTSFMNLFGSRGALPRDPPTFFWTPFFFKSKINDFEPQNKIKNDINRPLDLSRSIDLAEWVCQS